jgi:hypothetical protein
MQESNDLSFCPSFNAYSDDRLLQIADKVTAEESNELENEDDDFEFSSVNEVAHSQFRPVFPVFNRDVLLENNLDREIKQEEKEEIKIPLRKLFLEDREIVSSSSSEADELEDVAPGTYCVWRPKQVEVESSPSRCDKSRSTGSISKRWKFRDLLRRSNSDGKDSFVFLTPKSKEVNVGNQKERRKSIDVGKLKVASTSSSSSSSAHEAFYVRNRAIKEGDKRRSYLPYKQELVGFFANVNGLTALGPSGKTFPPF